MHQKLINPMLLLAFLPALVQADAYAKQIVLASGATGYSIRCDNQNVNACYEKAGDICHRGYTIENQSLQLGEVSHAGGIVGPNIGVASAVSSTTSEKGLIILCKESELTEAERHQREQGLADAKERQLKKQAEVTESGNRGGRVFFGVIFGALAATLAVVFFARA